MSTVRIKETTRAQLREIEEATGTGPSEALARAVDSFRRSLMFANTDLAYRTARENAADRQEFEDELRDWDGALDDGLDEEDDAS